MISCRDARAAIARGEIGEDDALLGHLETCEACADLAEESGLLADAIDQYTEEDEEILVSTHDRIAADVGAAIWLKTRPTWLRRTMAIASAIALFLFALVAVRRHDFSEYPVDRMMLTIAVMLVLLVASLWIGLRPLHQPSLPAWVNGTLTAVSVVATFLFAAVPTLYLPVAPHVDLLQALGMPCLYLGVLVGIPVYALARLLDRGASPLAAVLAALASGLTGNLVLQVHCAETSPMHLVFGHFSVLVAFLIVAAAMVLIELRVRKR